MNDLQDTPKKIIIKKRRETFFDYLGHQKKSANVELKKLMVQL